MPVSGTSTHPISILYVDDEPALLEIGRIFLEKSEGLTVSTCVSADEAIELIQHQEFDAIVSDYQMPGMNGLQFLQHLRKTGNQTPFIIFTGKGREDVVIEALNSGADFYLQKGGDPKSQFAELSNTILYAVAKRRSEIKLAHSYELMRYIIEHNNAAVAVHDMDMNYIFVSQQYLETYGVTSMDVIGRNHYDVFPDLPEKWREVHRKVLAGEGVFSAEDDLYPREDGRLDWTWWECRPWFESDRTIGGLIVYTEIITERKLREEEILRKNEELAAAEEEMRSHLEEIIAIRDQLKESNGYLNSLISYANAPIIVWDPDYTITRINHAFEDLTGVVAEDIVGEKLPMLFPEESGDEWMALIDRAMEGERLDAVEMPIIHQSGTVRNVIWNSAAIMDNDGITLRSVIAQGQDITERKVAEERLRKYQRRESDIINFLPDATFAIDSNGVVIAWNRAIEEMTGVPAEEMIGKGNYEYALPFYLERRPLLIDLALRDDPDIESRYPYVRRRGDTVFSEITLPHLRGGEGAALWFTASRLYDEEGNVAGAIESIRDITDRKQLEDKNRAIAGMLDIAPNSITIHDYDGQFLYANQKTFEIHGYSEEEFFSKKLTEIDVPSSAAHIEERMQQIARDGEASFEVEHWRKDGSIIPLEIFVKQVEWEGQPAILNIATDISERRTSEAALRESESRFRELAELLPQAVYETDVTGNLTYGNRKAFEMFGYSQKDVDMGLNALSKISPEYREKARENLIKVVRGNELDEPTREYLAIRKDGSTFPINIYSSLILHDGVLVGVRGIIIDITDKKEAEEKVKSEQAFIKTLLETSPAFFVAISKDGRILKMNSALLNALEYREEDLIGEDYLTAIVPEEEHGHLADIFSQIMNNEEATTNQNHILSRTGKKILVEWHGRRASSGEMAAGFIVGVGIDITGRIQAEDSLREANRKLTLLSSITRHDILNKIMTIKGYLDIAGGRESDEELAEYLEQLKNAADAIERQIEFTRQYDQIAVHDPKWTSLSDLLNVIDDSGLPITCDCDPVLIYAEPMIEKVFMNLYDNAIRHAEGATGITIRCRETDAGLLITWEDDGAGVPYNQKEKIFESGFGRHTGFGLFLVREILDITKITILETGVPGEGARFEILIPKDGYCTNPSMEVRYSD